MAARSTAGNNSHPAATGIDGGDQPRIPRAAHAGAEQPGAERDQGRATRDGSSGTPTSPTWANHWQAANGVTTGSPRITFTDFTIGGNTFYPRHGAQDIWSVRDDFTFSYDARGRHDLKAGVEYLRS